MYMYNLSSLRTIYTNIEIPQQNKITF